MGNNDRMTFIIDYFESLEPQRKKYAIAEIKKIAAAYNDDGTLKVERQPPLSVKAVEEIVDKRLADIAERLLKNPKATQKRSD